MTKSTHWSHCTAQAENGSFCEAPSIDGAPFPICIRHGAQLLQFLQASVEGIETAPLSRRLEVMTNMHDGKAEFERRNRAAAERAPKERVYYAQVGKLIKIGYTASLKKRMANYPPGSQLLAVENGDEHLEAMRHRQFAEFVTHGREWFTPATSLLDHIDVIRKRYGAKPLTRRQ